MSRDYKNIKKDTAPKASRLNGLLNFFSGLSIGLLVAVLVFFYGNQLAAIFKLKRPVATQSAAPTLMQHNEQTAKSPALPEPTFEFYNILPNREVDISAWVTRPPAKSTSPVPVEEGNYILQVGSFKQHQAADQVKAKLALLGFNAYIEPGKINAEDVFRVRIGPYSNLTKLKSARERLLANNLDFMQMRQ